MWIPWNAITPEEWLELERPLNIEVGGRSWEITHVAMQDNRLIPQVLRGAPGSYQLPSNTPPIPESGCAQDWHHYSQELLRLAAPSSALENTLLGLCKMKMMV